MNSIRRPPFVAVSVLLGLLLSAQAIAQSDPPGYDQRKANVVRGASAAALAAASQAGPAATVRGALRARGASEATANSLRETGSNTTRAGVTHVRMEQQVAGLTVYGRYVKAAVNARGELVSLIENVAPVPAAPLPEPRINAQRALQAAMARVHPGMQPDFAPSGAAGNTSTFAGGSFFAHDPSVTRVAIPLDDGTMEVGFLVETWTARDNQLHHTLVSGSGRVLNVELRTARDSYRVFTIDPLKTPQAIVAGPAPSAAAPSPNGWLGGGSQSTWAISGNNVSAYLDVDANNRADRGGWSVTDGNFVSVADLSLAPSVRDNRSVAVQNLFYLNNVIHDVLYGYGFDEAAGNFQQDNFGKGGAGRDPVLAEAQDGSGTDNANFATPSDGRSPRMQMYLWTGAGATHNVRVNAPTSMAADYAAMGAEFGPALTTTGLTGSLVGATTPADGCTAISTPLAGKVALIDRGACDFSVKVLNAQSAGAVGVIIANNQNTAIFTMGAGTNAKRVRIPAVMISLSDGAALKSGASNVTLSKLANQPLQIDASLDSDVVFHEYGHGLTWRMIGGMSGPLAGAVGEGMSDAIAMLINGDDAIGEYSSSSANGIRSARYSAFTRTYGSVTGSEVHDDGEPLAAIVWRMIESFGTSFGTTTGRAKLFRYVVDGMNYTVSTPAYEDIRDGILASISLDASPGNACSLVWDAFAQFGVGVGAKGTVLPDGTVQVTEQFVRGDCP